jgi:hypothetical protein
MPSVTDEVIPGEGTILSVQAGGSGGSYTPIALVTEIDGPEVMVEAIDATSMETGLIITRPSRFPEPDKLTMKVWFNASSHAGLITDMTTPGPINGYQLTFNDSASSTCTFTGFQTSFKLTGMKVKSNVEADVEIKLTSIPVFSGS